MNNRDRMAAMDQFRKRHQPPSWVGEDLEIPADHSAGILVGIAALVLALAIAYAFSQRHVESIDVNGIIAECESDGKVAHIERDGSGNVLAVRCARDPESQP